jgi:hypothetical protein
MRRFTLATPLSRREIVERLRETVGTAWLSGDEPVRGRVSEHSFSLRKRIGYRNSFQTNLRGRYVEEANGTRIKCYAGMHPFVVAFMTVWFALVLTASAAIATQVANGDLNGSPVVIIGMLIFGIVLVGAGRYAARNELTALTAFLEETIDARPAR